MKTKTTQTPGQHYYVREYDGLYHLMLPVGLGDLGTLRSVYASTDRAEIATLAAAPDLLEAAKEAESVFLALAHRFNGLKDGEIGMTQALEAASAIRAVSDKAVGL